MTSLKDILTKWPEYKKSTGFRLIDMDFNGLHPDSSSILDKWEEESKKIKEFSIERDRDKNIAHTLSALNDADFNNDYTALQLLRSIHGFLVPAQKIPRVNSQQ